MQQTSLAQGVSTHGKGLHLGRKTKLSLKPAEPNTGIRFRRVDLPNAPELPASVELVGDLFRSTSLERDGAQVHTVEHILSALMGCGVDNAIVELDASELPIFDGSAKSYVELIDAAGIVEQASHRDYFHLKTMLAVQSEGRSIIALPSDEFRVSCTSTDEEGAHTHFASLVIHPETYRNEIARARTFVIAKDIEPLLASGKIKGGDLDTAIIIEGDKVISAEPMRFDTEMARHKILDIIGDLSLLGAPLKAHIVAVCPGHALNTGLCAKIAKQKEAS